MTVVSIAIRATNLTARAFSTVGASLTALKTTVSTVGTSISGGLTSALANAGKTADEFGKKGTSAFEALNVKMLLIVGTAALVTGAIAKIGQALGDSINREVENLTFVTSVIEQFGLSESKAFKFSKTLNEGFAELGKTLPIAAKDISTINNLVGDDYLTSLKKRNATEAQALQVLSGVSVKTALAAQTAGISASLAGQNLQSFLAGSVGKQGIDDLTLFQRNAPLKRNLIEELEKTYGKEADFGKLSDTQRQNLYNIALDKSVTNESIERQKKTAKAALSQFTDSLFDPESGLFSIGRDLDKDMDGYQSVYESFKTTLDLTIGERGLFGQFGRIFGGNNPTDPMKVFKTSLDVFNAYLGGFNQTIAGLNSQSAGSVGQASGEFLATIVNTVFDGILVGVASVDYVSVLSGVGMGLYSFFANLDWKIYAAGSAVLIGSLLVPIVTGAVISVGGIIVTGILAAVGGVPLAVGAAIVLGTIAVVKLIQENWAGITKTAGDAFSYLYNLARDGLNTVVNAITRVVDDINRLIDSVLIPIGDFINSIGARVSGVVNGVGSTISTGVTTVAEAGNNAAEKTGNFFNSIGGFVSGLFSGARYNGQIPTAANGFISAMGMEYRQKPGNADLVIANTSEAIFRPDQLESLINTTYTKGQANSVNITFGQGSINLMLPSSTPAEMAEQVLQMIEDRLKSELSGRLA